MFKPFTLLVISAGLLAGCASVRDSRVNPFNWFGGGSGPVRSAGAEAGSANPLIPERSRVSLLTREAPDYAGRPVEQISEVLLERRPGGAILRVTGVADRVGPFDVRLVEDETARGTGTLAYTLAALQQAGPRSTGTRARMVTAAVWLTDQELASVSAIRVAGRSNALETRR